MENKGLLKQLKGYFINKQHKPKDHARDVKNHQVEHNFISCPNCQNQLK